MSRITPTPSRRTVITALSAAFLIPAATRSWAGTYVTIIAPTNIWSRLFKPNSALKIWSIYGDGNLAAPNRLRFELRPGDRYNNLSDIHNNRERTELSGSGSPFGFDETWQFTTSFKLSGYSGDSKWLVILQLLQIYNSATLPVLAIEVRSD